MRIKSVSQNLFRQNDSKLSIKLVVNLLDGMNTDSFYNLYEMDTYSYLTMNISPSIIFQYKSGGPYDRSQVARVTEMDLFGFINELNQFYTKFKNTKAFTYYTSGNITCDPGRDDLSTISLKSGDFIELEPGIIPNTDGKPLPGVYLYINRKEYKAELSVDEFEFLLYRISKLNLHSDSMNLVIARMLFDTHIKTNKSGGQSNISQPSIANIRGGTSIFQQKIKENQVDENPVDKRIIVDTPDSLDDIMNGF